MNAYKEILDIYIILMTNRKGQTGIDLLSYIAIGFVIAAVTIAAGASVLAGTSFTSGSVAALAITNATNAIGNLSIQMPLIATVFALVVVIGAVLMLRGRQ